MVISGLLLTRANVKMWLMWKTNSITAQKTIRFPLGISSVNVTKSAVSYGFGHIYWRNPFFVQWHEKLKTSKMQHQFPKCISRMENEKFSNCASKTIFWEIIYFLVKVTFNLTWKSPGASLYGWISKPCKVVYMVYKEYQ